jgi:hypothetical protein
MRVIRMGVSVALASAICIGLSVGVRGEEDALARAKELYRTAAYDEALALLDGLSEGGPSETLEVNEYRIFCLVALDRKEDARTAIAALVTANPSYQLSEAQASPRVRAAFKDVRQPMLPGLVQHAYADAKAAFDRKDPQAATQFERVLALLRDPDLVATPELTDLGVVAAAFRDLSAAREAAAATAAKATPTPAAPAGAFAGAPRANPPEPPVYRDGESDLVPAVTVAQPMPTAQLPERRIWTGAIEVLIDETGKVLSARMTMPIYGAYDRQLIQAAMNWTYRPALKSGMPARYLKVVNVRVDSRPPCSTFATAACRPAN